MKRGKARGSGAGASPLLVVTPRECTPRHPSGQLAAGKITAGKIILTAGRICISYTRNFQAKPVIS
jgi:hypothetical protein